MSKRVIKRGVDATKAYMVNDVFIVNIPDRHYIPSSELFGVIRSFDYVLWYPPRKRKLRLRLVKEGEKPEVFGKDIWKICEVGGKCRVFYWKDMPDFVWMKEDVMLEIIRRHDWEQYYPTPLSKVPRLRKASTYISWLEE